MPKLSILIPTLPQRAKLLGRMLDNLDRQIEGEAEIEERSYKKYHVKRLLYPDIEIVICKDNKKMSVGHKRNVLKALAEGDYLTYVDDDDQLMEDYISTILPQLNGVDLVVYKALMFENGRPMWNVIYDVKYQKDYNQAIPKRKYGRVPKSVAHREKKKNPFNPSDAKSIVGTAYRVPNHLMVWRSDIAKRVDFPDINMGEDGIWAQRMRGKVKKRNKIEKVLYHYLFDSRKTETQRRR